MQQTFFNKELFQKYESENGDEELLQLCLVQFPKVKESKIRCFALFIERQQKKRENLKTQAVK